MKAAEAFIRNFLKQEASAGILLMMAALAAIVVANSGLSPLYDMLLTTPVAVQVGTFSVDKPLLLWVNDGLMAVFFFLVGLELKREFMEGELKDKRNVTLPAFGALGGMVIPVLFYLYFNAGDNTAMQGWAIPAATDIAFALGILSLLGKRVPLSLKVFLTSLAIFDDVGAIVIIAMFFTEQITFSALIVAGLSIVGLFFMNKRGVTAKSVYILMGLIMWTAMLKSGVHATLAGVILAAFIPMRDRANPEISPLKELEHDLHTAVAFMILPIFAFCNAGIDLGAMTAADLMHPITLGIATGLFVGKQIGVFAFCWVALKLKLCVLPKGMTMASLYGAALLCGVGFTMSLFIGSLAFEETGVDLFFDERLGILIGSILSGVAGYILLRNSKRSDI